MLREAVNGFGVYAKDAQWPEEVRLRKFPPKFRAELVKSGYTIEPITILRGPFRS